MLGRRNIAANEIVCPVLAQERLRSETDTDTFIANDNLIVMIWNFQGAKFFFLIIILFKYNY